jgi:hypothetical protein
MKILRFSFLFIVVRFVIEGFSVARKMASWRRPRKELRILELQVTVRHMWYEWFRSLAYGG